MKKQLPHKKAADVTQSLAGFHRAMANFLDDFNEGKPWYYPPWHRHVDWEKEVKLVFKEHPEGLKPNEFYNIIVELHGCTYQEARSCCSLYLYSGDSYGIRKIRKDNSYIFKLA